jgi:pyridoxal phosphate enzyme (YggS family)
VGLTTNESAGAGDQQLPEHDRARCRENWLTVQARVKAACQLAGRVPESVRIVGVTKYVGVPATAAVVEAGCTDLGESRPQALWEKAAAFEEAGLAVKWHLIGHLQRNKVARTLACRPLVQTLDSERLAVAVDRDAQASGHPCEVLVEVNLSTDPSRSGVPLSDVEALVSCALALPGLRLRGLMGMASHPEAGIDPRREFAQLRVLRDELAERCPQAEGLTELSMGMSGDFEAAILEGSTIVRIGSALFEGLR